MSSPTLAIIIPVGPGDGAWKQLIVQLPQLKAQQVLIVAGFNEAMPDLLDQGNVSIIRSEIGRAKQLNTGADVANADWLWFLHADSIIDQQVIDALWNHIHSGHQSIGYFDLDFHDGPWWMVVNRWGAWFRSRVLQMPFGDQGFLMPTKVFDALGGFDTSLGRGEDHALIWSARKQGIAVTALPAKLFTSARRYVEYGWWRTTSNHIILTLKQAMQFSRREPSM